MANYMSVRELSERWKIHPGTLANWRIKGIGPKYIKIGKKILYDHYEIEAYEMERVRENTAAI